MRVCRWTMKVSGVLVTLQWSLRVHATTQSPTFGALRDVVASSFCRVVVGCCCGLLVSRSDRSKEENQSR